MQFKINLKSTLISPLFSFQKFQIMIWQILLFLMIFIPRTGQMLKLIILSLLLIMSLMQIIKTNKLRISNEVRVFFILHIIYVTSSGLLGMIKGNPGAQDFLRINLLYYILFFIIISSFSTWDAFHKTVNIIVISSNFVSVYSLLLLLVSQGIWPEKYFIYFDATSNVGIHGGYTHLVNTNLSMMIFILPFLIILYFNNFRFKSINRGFILFTILLGIIATLLSGRRILWLSFVIPVCYYIFKFEKKKIIEKVKIISITTLVFLAIYIFITASPYLSFEMMIERFKVAFDSDQESTRFLQTTALWRGFLENPILGSGAGIGVDGIIRSITTPWIYEMSYNLILYNSGLLGMSFFVASHIYLLLCFYKEKQKKSKLGESFFITYIVVLLSNATNPYFTSSFDFLWFIFLPLMYLNLYKININRLGS